MVNYSAVINIIKSEKYIDKSDCFEHFWGLKHVTLENCAHTGSSLFLKTFACFLDERLNATNVFQQMRVGKTTDFSKEINSYRVLYLDFSDFNARNYDEANRYIKAKMADAYKDFHSLFDYSGSRIGSYQAFEDALDIIGGTASEQVLQRSLYNLVLQLRGCVSQKNDTKLAVLIDNMVSLETISRKYGYQAEMDKFLSSFIVKDVYDYCDVFLQIGDPAEEGSSWIFRDRYLTYCNFCTLFSDIHNDRHRKLIVDKEQQNHFDIPGYISEAFDWDAYIANGRKKIQQAKKEIEQERQRRILYEKQKYAIELSPDIPRFSQNMGIRKKIIEKTSPGYQQFNALLVGIYNKFKPSFDAESIYEFFQGFNKNVRIVRNTNRIKDVLEKLTTGNPKWEEDAHVSVWGGWVQTTFFSKDSNRLDFPACSKNIKVYAYFSHADIQEIFIDSLRYLLDHAVETFAAKLASFNRNDQMCYWLSPDDFRHLEEFYRPYAGNMEKRLPFVAYRGKLGISKDFPGSDISHNFKQSHIIADYFQTVTDAQAINLEDMYNNYIAKWNADIYEEGDYGTFKSESALSFIVIMDTLDAILGKTEINDDSALLSKDSKLWNILSASHCWEDVNERWNQAVRDETINIR